MQEPARSQQVELALNSASNGEQGYQIWQEQRRQTMIQTAQRMGLPLDHNVEVWLTDGTLLKGRLLLADEAGSQMMIGRATFKLADIQSCVRLD